MANPVPRTNRTPIFLQTGLLLGVLGIAGCATPKEGISAPDTIAVRSSLALPPGVSLANPITEDEAVWIALLNNAAFKEAMVGVGLAEADVIQAKTLPNPTLSMLFPAGPKQLEFAVKYPLEAIWLRPRRVAVARLDAEGIGKTLQQTGLDLVRDVRVAYTNLEATKSRVVLAGEAVELSNKVSSLVQALRKGGTALELDETTALGDKLQAELELTRLTDDVRIAEIRMRKLLGVGDMRVEIRSSGTDDLQKIPSGLKDLLSDAFAARPDLRAAEIAIESAVQKAGLAQVDAYKLTAILDTNGSGRSFEAGPGIDVAIPIFDRSQAGNARARALIDKASKHYLVVRDQIVLEVEESYALASQARRVAGRWQSEVIPPLERAVGQAEKAYKGGAVPFLQVVETNRKLTAAKLRYAEERANLDRAIAELERAVGHGLP